MALVAILMPALMFAAQKKTQVYVCGFASSFNDSTVYFTDIQQIDDAYTDSKTGFLYSRDNYSFQLKDYLQKLNVAHPTCVTFYAKKRKDIEKKYFAMKKRYATKGRYNVKYIAGNDFSYNAIIPDESEMKDTPAQPKAKKAKKAKEPKKEKEPKK